MSFTPFLLFECISYLLAAVIKKTTTKSGFVEKGPTLLYGSTGDSVHHGEEVTAAGL